MSRSTDSGETWKQESIRISPAGVISTVFPQTDAGDPGRIAITYLGSENTEMLNQTDIDGNPWNGNAHYAPNNASYHLYITYSLNALMRIQRSIPIGSRMILYREGRFV